MNKIHFTEGFPRIERMASGHLCLELSDSIGYEHFFEYAELIMSKISGRVKNRNNSYVTCIWDVLVRGDSYRLVYEDYPCLISLESSSDCAYENIENILKALVEN